MKALRMGLVTVFSTLAMVATAAVAFAQTGLDAKTRDTLIQKLTTVHLNLASKDPAKVPVTLRLADLHAERARLSSVDELNSGCTTCNAGKQDRAKALSLYREVLPSVPPSGLGKVLTQMGHLHEMVGNEREAIATYERIIKETHAKDAIAEAHLSLGEIFFKRRDFSSAKSYFKKVVEIPSASSRGLASYRAAWCEFNLGNLEPAIKGLTTILRTPELMTRSANIEVVQADQQFQEEVSRDLATFLARRPLSSADADLIFELSPDKAKLANATYLAGEAERLGQVKPAIAIWRLVQGKQSKPLARLETHVHLAQLQMEQRMITEAARDFETALGLWANIGSCQEGNCKELKARLRKFMLDWNRTEKTAPSEALLAAYQGYIKTFPNEADMALWAAKVATDLKHYDVAMDLALKASELSQGKADKENADRAEQGLLMAVEAAELAKDVKLRQNAYETYLEKSRVRKKALEVQYQLAHMIYTRGEYGPAAEALRAVALSKDTSNPTAKKQAADLSLDALVILKDDKRLEAWAADYAKAFEKDSAEFTKIARKSVLTQSTQLASNQEGREGLEKAWATLARFDAGSATNDEKLAYHKNRLILAEKLSRFREARDAAETLLRLPGLTQADRDFALSRQAWLAELNLDFGTALVATEKLSTAGDSTRWLKLAMYADLALKDPRPYYGKFLKDSKDEEKNAAIAAEIVRNSKEPAKDIERERTRLINRPELLATLYLEIFGKTASNEVAKKALSIPQVAAAPAGRIMTRALFLEEVAKLKSRVVWHQLNGKNQKLMAQTLKARVAMLEEIEKQASRAVSGGDWTSQLVVLDLLAKQSDRFYREILSLPVPQGLSPEEEQQYLSLLSQQAAPHQTRATDIVKKVEEFWRNETAIPELAKGMAGESGARRSLLVKEIQALRDVAPEAKKTQLAEIAAMQEAKKEIPVLATVEAARQAVREKPLDRTRLENLLALEKKLGRPAMVAYLEGRIQTLQPSGEAN